MPPLSRVEVTKIKYDIQQLVGLVAYLKMLKTKSTNRAEKRILQEKIDKYKPMIADLRGQLKEFAGTQPRSNPDTILSENPKKIGMKNLPDGCVEIYDNIQAIEAVKGKNSLWPGEPFRHDFHGKAKIFGLPNGDLLVRSTDGKPLWKNFQYSKEDVEASYDDDSAYYKEDKESDEDVFKE